MERTPDTSITSGTLTFGDNKVHCLRMGRGSRLLIALHGFGTDSHVFSQLLPFLNDEFTIVAFDLPGHGQTHWESKYFDQKALMALIQGIKNDFNTERFSLLGQSLGGRLALNIVGLQPSWVAHLILLAPDGLKKNFWYYFATRNLLGRYLFRNILADPETWLRRLSFLKKVGWVPEAQFRMAHHHLMNPTSRARLAYVWPVMSLLTPLIRIIKWNIRKYKIRTDIFMGQNDLLFPPPLAANFVKHLKKGTLHTFPTGHNVFTEKYFPEIATCLLQPENQYPKKPHKLQKPNG